METYRFTKKLIKSISTEIDLKKLESMSLYCWVKSTEAYFEESNPKKEVLYDSRLALISARYFELLNYKVGTVLKLKMKCTVDAREFTYVQRTITKVNNDMSINFDKDSNLDFGNGETVLTTCCFNQVYNEPVLDVEIIELEVKTNEV